MHLFPDTHFFLHFKHAQDIPWGDVTAAASEVRLVVGRAVSKELEKKKFEMRGRPQDRARTYVSKLAEVAINGAPAVLRTKNPPVTLELRHGRAAGWIPPADLDPIWFDDILLADVLAFTHEHPEADVAVLTGDPGLIAKAKGHGLEVISLLGRGWELAVEKTPEEKELEKLRRENEELKRAGPSIVCDLRMEGESVEGIDVEVVTHPPLTDVMVEILLSDLKQRHPKVTEFPPPAAPATLKAPRAPGSRGFDLSDLADPIEWKSPSDDELAAYSGDYDRWLREAAFFIRAIPSTFDGPSLSMDVDMILQNLGNDPAEEVRLYIETRGDLLLSEFEDAGAQPADGADIRKPTPTKFRLPPPAPKWQRVEKPLPGLGGSNRALEIGAALAAGRGDLPGMGGPSASLWAHERAGRLGLEAGLLGDRQLSISSILNATRGFSAAYPAAALFSVPSPFEASRFIPTRPEPRKRYLFYRFSTPASKQGAGVAYECEEFRHRFESETFSLRLSLDASGPVPRNGAIHVRLSAGNLRQLFEKTFPLRIKIVEADVGLIAADLLP
jgi:hypothetical protein